MNIIVKNARVVTPYEILEDHAVLVRDGIISDIRKDPPEENIDAVVDARGYYLGPGFIDIHNHGNSGKDFMDASFDAYETMAKFHLAHGVTGFLATVMTGSFDEMEKALSAAGRYIKERQGGGKKARMLGIYLEGPYFSPKKKGAQPPEHIRKPDVKELKELIEASCGTVRVVSLAPEVEGAEDAIRYLKEKRITIAMGHTDATYEEAKRGINLGITLATHTFNGMRGFEHRQPGAVGACLVDDRVYCEIICDGIHLSKAAVDLTIRAKGREKVVLVSDAMMATGLSDGEYTLGGQRVFVKDGRAALADGTIAGSTLTLDRAVRYLVKTLGVPLKDALRMASLNPAKAVGLSDRKGSIEQGKDADMVIFDDNLDIKTVIVGGEVFNFTKLNAEN
ncbi:MAG: hypothetical protein PWP45_1580 [Tepidanaerobacteraceae bacterium]|nr:hypothetical protein [Tepidanaerobacteraceae bacterium]